MIVTVISVWVMQMAVNDVVGMIAVRNRLMTACRTMLVITPMGTAIVRRRAIRGIVGVHLKNVFVNVISMRMVKMTVVQIIRMIAVLNHRMPAIRPMYVFMIFMFRALFHRSFSSALFR